jgi:outer membrane protein TolC
LGALGALAQSLEDYFEIAAENNPGLQSKYLEYEIAMEKIPQVSSLQDPVFSFGYFISPVETRVGPQRAKFSLTQVFPWFGSLKAREDAAALMAEAKFQDFIDARNQLLYRVSAAYYPLYELDKKIRIEKENIRILESYQTIARAKFRNNDSPMVDVLRVEILLEDARTALEILEKKREPLVTTFNKLLNREPDLQVTIADTTQNPRIPENYRRDSMLTGHPALKSLDLKIKANEAAETAAQKQGLPKIGAGLDYVIVDEGPLATADNGKDVLMPMVSVTIPLFRGKYRSAVREAELNQEKYALQREDISNSLESGYEMALFDYEKQLALLALYRKQVATSEQSLTLLFTSYSNSGKDFEEVLRMQQQLLKYEKLVAEAEAESQVARARINYITAKTY